MVSQLFRNTFSHPSTTHILFKNWRWANICTSIIWIKHYFYCNVEKLAEHICIWYGTAKCTWLNNNFLEAEEKNFSHPMWNINYIFHRYNIVMLHLYIFFSRYCIIASILCFVTHTTYKNTHTNIYCTAICDILSYYLLKCEFKIFFRNFSVFFI